MPLRHRLVEQHVTPRAVYSVVYAPGGGRLLAGGGFWYGQGFITCIERGRASPWICREGPPEATDFRSMTISGLSFDAAGRHVAVSGWTSGHDYFPALLYGIEGDALSARDVHFDPKGQVERMNEVFGRGTATGVLLHEGFLVVRRTNPLRDITFSVFRLPEGVIADSGSHHLRSARIVGLPGGVATGFLPSPVQRMGTIAVETSGGSEELSNDRGTRLGDGGALLVGQLGESSMTACFAFANPHALDAASARRAWDDLALEDIDDSVRVTFGVRQPPGGTMSAITVDASGARMITCGSDGSIVRWSHSRTPDGAVELQCVERYKGHAMPISAACHLASGLLVTADRAGRVRVWDGTERVCEWTVPEASVRTLAAHPLLPRLAVGCKAIGGGPRPGLVAVYEIDA